MNNKINTQDIILSDESMEKVIIITDIAKVGKALGMQPPSPEDFDRLYDLDIPTLVQALDNAQHMLRYKQTLERLSDLALEISRSAEEARRRQRDSEDDAC